MTSTDPNTDARAEAGAVTEVNKDPKSISALYGAALRLIYVIDQEREQLRLDLAAAREEAAAAKKTILELEHIVVTWGVDCAHCAQYLDQGLAETFRAEKAEKERDAATARIEIMRRNWALFHECREHPYDAKRQKACCCIECFHAATARAAGAERLREALRLASVRLGICAGRMRACREETGGHELLEEVEMFAAEARTALDAPRAGGERSCRLCRGEDGAHEPTCLLGNALSVATPRDQEAG